MHRKILCLLVLSCLSLSSPRVQAQDVDVPGNLKMVDSTATAGNILKGGFLFTHNFGTNNTFLGRNAGNLTMTGVDNTARGTFALFSNTSGVSNTASGVNALFSNTSGGSNTASGVNALFSNTSGGNTASGTFALFSNTSGDNNTASGVNALQQNTTAVGFRADVSFGNLINATAIGANATVDQSNKIRLAILESPSSKARPIARSPTRPRRKTLGPSMRQRCFERFVA